MPALEVAADHARTRTLRAERIRSIAREAWAAVDPAKISETWLTQIGRLLLILTGGQHAAAATADRYVAEVLVEQGLRPAAAGRVDASALAGIASDGRPLESLLARPAITAKLALSAGTSIERAMAAGGAQAELIAHTQVADAGRVADQVALVVRKGADGYTRMVVGDSCARCLIMAGRRYEWNAGFLRHPKCDCVHIPTAEDVSGDLRTSPRLAFDAMTGAEQDKVFGKAGAEAIREGSDMARVVNARRGMQAAADGRLYTTEAAGKRPRLMPEQIFRDARDRDDAIRLLRLHRYIL